MIDFHDLGSLATVIGKAEFGELYFSVTGRALKSAQCTVFVFPEDAEPKSLVLEGRNVAETRQARELASQFLAGDFRSDPNLRRQNLVNDAIIVTHSASTIEDAEFRQRFYDDAQLTSELVMLGRVDGLLLYASFYRSTGDADFDETDAGLLQPLAPLLLAMLYRHLELMNRDDAGLAFTSQGERIIDRSVLLRHLSDVMLAEGNGLSPRESEICAFIVAGYSALAISLKLGISENTVTTHRKRAYAKLSVSSQNELFVRYFTTVTRLRIDPSIFLDRSG